MRKLFIAAALAAVLPVSLASAATDAGAPAWNYEAFKSAIEAGGRSQNISDKTFKRLQENRLKSLKIIEKYLTRRFGKADPLVMKAFAEVPREYYHFNYQSKNRLRPVPTNLKTSSRGRSVTARRCRITWARPT